MKINIHPDEPVHLWPYWRDKKGIEEALTGYFPKTIAGNPALQHALQMMQVNQLLIDSLMTIAGAENDCTS